MQNEEEDQGLSIQYCQGCRQKREVNEVKTYFINETVENGKVEKRIEYKLKQLNPMKLYEFRNQGYDVDIKGDRAIVLKISGTITFNFGNFCKSCAKKHGLLVSGIEA